MAFSTQPTLLHKSSDSTNPRLAKDYVAYLHSRIRNQGNAVRRLYEGVEISGFTGFSEYHSCAEFVEADEYAFLMDYPFPPGPILDIGANLGVVSLILAHRYPNRTIHAFEPNPSTAQALRSNLIRNGASNVTPHPLAVGANNTPIQFEAHPRERGTASQTSVDSEFTKTVPCTSVESFAEDEQWSEIAFMKVDVEGYEMSVFEGARPLLRGQRIAVIYFEVCPLLARQAGFDPHGPALMLEQFGYKLNRVAPRGDLISAEASEVANVDSENWVAIRP